MKGWQLMGDTSWGPFCFQGTHQAMEKLCKILNSIISTCTHPHLHPAPGCDLRLGRGHKCRQKEFPELTLPEEVKRFWTHLLNFTFSIWYFLCVHEGVEYPLQEKPERKCERLFCHKCPRKAAPRGGWVRKRGQRRAWALSQCQVSQGNHGSMWDLHAEAEFGRQGITGFYPHICLFTKLT